MKITTMRKPFFKCITIFMLSLAVVSCKNKAEETVSNEGTETVEVSVESTIPEALVPAESSLKYMANPANTLIEWTGSKPTGKHLFY